MSDERFDAAWFAKAGAGYIATCLVFGGLGLAFGWLASFIGGMVILAYCLGVFYGAGSEIRKRERED